MPRSKWLLLGILLGLLLILGTPFLSAMDVAQLSGNSFLHIPLSGGGSADVSLVGQSLPDGNGTVLPVVAERSLYFNYNGTTPGSTSVMGYTGS